MPQLVTLLSLAGQNLGAEVIDQSSAFCRRPGFHREVVGGWDVCGHLRNHLFHIGVSMHFDLRPSHILQHSE